jgi:hypothetical protein
MKRIAFVVFLLAVAGAAWWWLRPARQAVEPVETWTKGRGAGQEVRLFASGRYESSAFCDVCPPAAKTGTWRETATGLVLAPAGGRPVTLNKVIFRGCRALVAERAPAPRLPTDVFFPASESCGNAL